MSVDLNLNIKNTVSIETSIWGNGESDSGLCAYPNTQVSNTLNANFIEMGTKTLCSQSNYREPRRKKGKS